MSSNAITNMTVNYNVALITVDNLPGNLSVISKIFNSLAGENINIDMISQAPPFRGSVNLSFTLPADDLVKAISSLNKFKKDIPNLHIEVDAQNTKISVFGEGMKNLPGVAARLFTILANEGVEIKLVTTSEVDISYLVYDKDVDKAIESIKKEYSL